MAGSKGRTTVSHRILMGFQNDIKFSDDSGSFDDMGFGYFEEEDPSPEIYRNDIRDNDNDDDSDENNPENVAENKAFWEDQNQLLQATLIRTTSIESKIRQATKEGMKEYQSTGGICVCSSRLVNGGCRICIMKAICDLLLNAGFNSAICRSKWRKSLEIPSGEHTYIDVVDSSSKKGEVRVIIELNFRAEFVMARGNEEYNKLINRLPEVFVGKAERLRTLIKILCSAAKKCMKENKMHMGPWRKHKYMQAKWFGNCERTISAPILTEKFSNRERKPKSSLLTFDLLETLPSLQRFSAVKVV